MKSISTKARVVNNLEVRAEIIAQLLIAALEAMATLLMIARIINVNISGWGTGRTLIVYFLLVILYLIFLKGNLNFKKNG